MIPERCPVLNQPLKYQGGAFSPTIDRLNPELGYIRGNITVISRKANLIKQNATVSEIRAVADWLERSLGNV